MSKRGLFSRRLSNRLPNPISQCIDSEQWERVIGLAQSKPEMCQKWTERSGFFEGIRAANVLPIHEACANESVPFSVVQALVQAYPESVRVTESAYHRLPLHIVCRKTTNAQAVHYLLSEYSDAALEPDALGRLPLHYALSNGANDDVVNLLLEHGPSAVRGVDRKGWTPLHVACSMGASTHLTHKILELYPQASVMSTHRGTSVISCMKSQTSPNKAQVIALVEHYQKQVQRSSPTHSLSPQGSAELVDRAHLEIV
jgi:ankyrin repeat protein